MLSVKQIAPIVRNVFVSRSMMTSSSLNCTGGKHGGSVREAGGKFAEMESAREDMYVRKLEKQQLENLKKDLDREVEHHEREMKHHEDAIKRHKKRAQEIAEMAKKEKDHH